MAVFGYTTYHRHFWKWLPILLLWAALNGSVFDWVGLSHYWLTFLIVFSGLVLFAGIRQKRQLTEIMNGTDDAEALRFIAASGSNTLTYFWLSAFAFILMWFVGFLVAFNLRAPGLTALLG